MIFDRLAILFADLVPDPGAEARRTIRRTVSARARRWGRAAVADPRLAADVLALGGVHETTARDGRTGAVVLDPNELAHAAGRRDLALELVALMGVTPFELRELMLQENTHETHDDDLGPGPLA
ncbi:hypothetical protein P2H44_22720 [Albimonas sp. CAU 1670]|uniref:hypothetical protein n=1 Tax=Albimonas sp. CAU 1670 TaxID=3032599 RepID=UPI0023DC8624|nr:hypothetical protein [Albimonas sp. CAU 1670]MDF2235379.1 hypothetical protein [Albimonas sp. CAU 1670]